MKAGNPKTVGELLSLFENADLSKPLVGTYETTWAPVYIYEAKDGTAVVDLDAEFYREQIESGDIPVEHG